MILNSDRYKRHLHLPDFGEVGQRRLLNAKVLLVGMGGLGSPCGLYLAAAGVGTIGIVEFDTVDMSNLQRQILYETSQIGKPKIEMAAHRLHRINPEIKVIQHHEKLTEQNAKEIFFQYDYVIDATDNFAARYLICDTSLSLKKIHIYGSIYQYEGQISVLNHPEGPCYRCLFPMKRQLSEIKEEHDLAVIGVLPGIIGTLQATEAIKLICGLGTPLIGKMLIYDSMEMAFTKVNLDKNTNCSCSRQKTGSRRQSI